MYFKCVHSQHNYTLNWLLFLMLVSESSNVLMPSHIVAYYRTAVIRDRLVHKRSIFSVNGRCNKLWLQVRSLGLQVIVFFFFLHHFLPCYFFFFFFTLCEHLGTFLFQSDCLSWNDVETYTHLPSYMTLMQHLSQPCGLLVIPVHPFKQVTRWKLGSTEKQTIRDWNVAWQRCTG